MIAFNALKPNVIQHSQTFATKPKLCEQIMEDLQTMRNLVSDEMIDLVAKIPHGDGQTVLHEALLVADHNAYHLGQIAFLMRILETK